MILKKIADNSFLGTKIMSTALVSGFVKLNGIRVPLEM